MKGTWQGEAIQEISCPVGKYRVKEYGDVVHRGWSHGVKESVQLRHQFPPGLSVSLCWETYVGLQVKTSTMSYNKCMYSSCFGWLRQILSGKNEWSWHLWYWLALKTFSIQRNRNMLFQVHLNQLYIIVIILHSKEDKNKEEDKSLNSA